MAWIYVPVLLLLDLKLKSIAILIEHWTRNAIPFLS